MIYFIQAGDSAVKIGWTESIERRFNTLQGAHYEELKIIHQFEGDKEIEKEFHNAANKYHIRGEWFDKKVLKDIKIKRLIKKQLESMPNKSIELLTNEMNIKKLREAKSMSREDLASKISVSVITIYNWEQGRKITKKYERELKRILGREIK